MLCPPSLSGQPARLMDVHPALRRGAQLMAGRRSLGFTGGEAEVERSGVWGRELLFLQLRGVNRSRPRSRALPMPSRGSASEWVSEGSAWACAIGGVTLAKSPDRSDPQVPSLKNAEDAGT